MQGKENDVGSLIKEIPSESKPRERLLHFGEQALATHELLAILLRTGRQRQSALDVASELLQKVGDLYTLKQSSIEEIKSIKGIGTAKAIEIKAAIELGFRCAKSQQVKHGIITSSQQAGEYLINEFKGLNQEHLIVLFLNTKHDIIRKKTMFIGSATQSIADPRDIFRDALKLGAIKLIVAHNHPSGHPDPSQEDIFFTKRIIEAGKIVGISVLDHVIVGDNCFVSLKEQGYI